MPLMVMPSAQWNQRETLPQAELVFLIILCAAVTPGLPRFDRAIRAGNGAPQSIFVIGRAICPWQALSAGLRAPSKQLIANPRSAIVAAWQSLRRFLYSIPALAVSRFCAKS